MFGRKIKTENYAIVTARRTGDNIVYTTIDATNRARAERLAQDEAKKGGVFVAVIDYTGQPRWCYGHRVAFFGEEL